MTPDARGLILCSRYSFAPNLYHYCGPEKQSDILGYVKNDVADGGLAEILHRFETLYPYLVLIASQNNIKDPFDRRVVEAYWLGNTLLHNVKSATFATHLSGGLALKRKLPMKSFAPMMDRMIDSGMPQHTFHVLNIFIRTGHHAITHTLPTMDSCRISWGRVIHLETDLHFIVDTQPLVCEKDKLLLGLPQKKVVTSVSVKPKVGDWVSIHWGYVCDILTAEKRRKLNYFTSQAIRVANQDGVGRQHSLT